MNHLLFFLSGFFLGWAAGASWASWYIKRMVRKAPRNESLEQIFAKRNKKGGGQYR
jgi:hypothetical protein